MWNFAEVTHYRLSMLASATTEATDSINDKLTALRLMSTQNRLALDLMLAKEGGVCAMVGEHCCTYVPTNDAPGGNISHALENMKKVTENLRRDEEGRTTWGLWWDLFGWFSPYASAILHIIVVLIFIFLFGP